MIKLPNELINQTLEELWDDTAALASCAGTCSRLRKLTHRIFFADITINLHGPVAAARRRLERLESVLPFALPYLRVLRINFGLIDFSTCLFASVLFRSIATRATLKELYMKGRFDVLGMPIVSRLTMLPSIQVLSFFACPNVPVTAFQNRPTLRALHLRHCSVVAPFEFTHYYSTDAVYQFAQDGRLDAHNIGFPNLLELSLGLPEHPSGDRSLLQRCGTHLTSLTLYLHSTEPKDYDALVDVSLDNFPALSSLTMLFEIAIDIQVPINLLAFLRGKTGKNSIRHLHLGFDHLSPFFEDLVDILPYIMCSIRPFAIEEVFDRKLLPHLQTGCCVLQLSVYSITECDPEDVERFQKRANAEFADFFARAPGKLDWVSVTAEVGESTEDVDAFQ